MDPSILYVAGSGCCCFAVMVGLVALGSVLLRPRRPKPGDVAGLPPAPNRGVQTRASMTRMEEALPPPVPPATTNGTPGATPVGPRVIPATPTVVSSEPPPPAKKG